MRLALRWLGAAVALSALTAGCAHGAIISHSLVEMDSTATSADVKDSAPLAPQELAHAEQERALAHDADAHGDATGAELHAARALVAYGRAAVLARLARATTAGEAARSAVAKSDDDAQRLVAARAEFDKAADATATELAVARDARAAVRIGPADATREKARLVAAQSLAAEGHLLCGAARLLATATSKTTSAPVTETGTIETTRLEAAEHDDAALEGTITHPVTHAAAPLETAARVRATCLDVLTRSRRSAGGANAGDADALLSAISSHGGWLPSRDERGVVVTFRETFKGAALTTDAAKQLQELGKVAAAHPTFPLQIVIHDALAPSDSERTADTARAQAALAALTQGGAVASQAHLETVGARLPTTDPTDARTRARNARLEVVFISRGD
jgi:hypothetical protein